MTAVRACLALSVAIAAATAALAREQAPVRQDNTSALVDAAAVYVSRFITQFSNLVASEDYAQSQVRSQSFGFAPTRRRRLTSDLYFVRASENDNWLVFRDVLTVDGRALTPRPERIIELLTLPGAAAREIADRVAADSAQHSLPDWPTLNSPVLAMFFFQEHYRARFRITLDERASTAAEAVLHFDERTRPTLFKAGDVALFAFGELRINRADGRILESVVRLSPGGTNQTLVTMLRTTFGTDARLGVDVPIEMREYHYFRASNLQLQGTANYGNFRRFDVKTTEQRPPL